MRVHRDPAGLFASHRDELAHEFPPDARVPLVGDARSSESGTLALHLRRKVERLSLEDVARAGPRSVLAIGAEARAALVDRGYHVAAVLGQWALLRRESAASMESPR